MHKIYLPDMWFPPPKNTESRINTAHWATVASDVNVCMQRNEIYHQCYNT